MSIPSICLQFSHIPASSGIFLPAVKPPVQSFLQDRSRGRPRQVKKAVQYSLSNNIGAGVGRALRSKKPVKEQVSILSSSHVSPVKPTLLQVNAQTKSASKLLSLLQRDTSPGIMHIRYNLQCSLGPIALLKKPQVLSYSTSLRFELNSATPFSSTSGLPPPHPLARTNLADQNPNQDSVCN
jgi:hypothetical protein